MKEEMLLKIEEVEENLGVVLPTAIRELILSLQAPSLRFGEEEWYFNIYDEKKNDPNSIVEDSLLFKKEWNMNALVFAENGKGDYLLLLPKIYPKKIETELDDTIFVFWHELGEIRIFAYDLSETLDENFNPGPDGDDFAFRINEDDSIEEGFELRRIYDPVSYVEYLKTKFPNFNEIKAEGDGEGEEWLQLHERVNQVSLWIDEEKTEQIDQMLSTLDECLEDEFLGPRAHWLLNKIYMKGLGIPVDQSKAIDHAEKSAAGGNYNAMADLSFYYFKGLGVKQSNLKAIEWMESANEKSEGLLEEQLEALKNLQAQKN